MSDSKSSSSRGLGLFSVLTIIFVVLKVLGVAPVATWSWLWVFSPVLVWFALALAFFLLIGLIAFVAHLFNR